jgi:hypothetical protein
MAARLKSGSSAHGSRQDTVNHDAGPSRKINRDPTNRAAIFTSAAPGPAFLPISTFFTM